MNPMFRYLCLLLAGVLLVGCASSGPYYTVAASAPTATIIVGDNINMRSTWNSQKEGNPLGMLFRAVNSINALMPGRRAAIYAIDDLPTQGQVSRLKVEAGKHQVHLVAGLSNSVARGTLAYHFAPGHEYTIRVQVADASGKSTAGAESASARS